MKKVHLKRLAIIALFLVPTFAVAQDLVGQIETWKQNLRIVVNSIIGLVAIGGGIYVYLKMSNSDGDSGKKALLNYIGSLIFAALMWGVIQFFTS